MAPRLHAVRLSAALLLAFLVTACAAPRDLVVVVPDRDGSIGQVTVSSLDGSAVQVLDGAYAAAEVSGGQVRPSTITVGEVEATFAGALAARPIPPSTFTLYFLVDSEDLTPASIAKFDEVFADIARRSAYEVEVIGHTDRVGEETYNDGLSRARADRIRTMFVERGLMPEVIFATGRGERDLVVPTADEVPEPLNRRVEIDVR